MLVLWSLCVLLGASSGSPRTYSDSDIAAEEKKAWEWMAEYNKKIVEFYFESNEAEWALTTNITDFNEEKSLEAGLRLAQFQKEMAVAATVFPWREFKNDTLKRMMELVARIGTAVLPADEKAKLDGLSAAMQRIYSVGKVDGKSLDPDLTRLMATSRDAAALAAAWTGWRNVSRPMRRKYAEFVKLENRAALMNGFADRGDEWRSVYETDIRKQALDLWETVKPLYRHLHAYVKRKLQKTYADSLFTETGQIPAHLLGNMWAQSWNNVMDLMVPYPEAAGVNVGPALREQNYTVLRIFKLSESFFTSLGLEPMPDIFWNNSMMVRPDDGREVVCHASAWDFSNGKDFRISQCTEIDMEWLLTTHHEMGHIQYYLQYKDLPFLLRGGANPGFHEAVGDVLSLSVATPDHLAEIGLLEDGPDDKESDMNFLMQQALDKVAFLPFGLLIDMWRWDVFSGATPEAKYNQDWWKYRCAYQGVSPASRRTEIDFDPGAKFHVPSHTPYMRYFVSFILQFQFHEALCRAANNTRPLHRCSIYKSLEAGEKFGAMLRLGASVPWPDALESLTGTREMDARPLLDYFQPLYAWLQEQNEGHSVDWDEACPAGLVDSAPSLGAALGLVVIATLACLLNMTS